MPVLLKKQMPVLAKLQGTGVPAYGPEDPLPEKVDLRLAVLNLMPNKEETEEQLLQLLADSPRRVEVSFIALRSYRPKHTSPEYMSRWYEGFSTLGQEGIDGLIITGAPLEHLDFARVLYWQELTEIMDYARARIPSTLFLCWAAPAALWHYYQIPISLVEKKISGVFPHRFAQRSPLFRGIDPPLSFPHSRYFTIKPDSLKGTDLGIVAKSRAAGISILASPEGRQVYVAGHFEYGRDTLHKEYFRDLARGLDVRMPEHYYPGDNAQNPPPWSWRETAAKFYGNWLHYCAGRKGAWKKR